MQREYREIVAIDTRDGTVVDLRDVSADSLMTATSVRSAMEARWPTYKGYRVEMRVGYRKVQQKRLRESLLAGI